jgi:hypothetical protein
MHLSTGGSSSAGSMRDVEFPQIRSFEARQMAGPTLKSSLFPRHIPASSTTSPNLRRRRIYKKVEAAQPSSSPPKRRSAACSSWKNPPLRTLEGHDLARSRARPIGAAFRAGELRRTRPHGHTLANIFRRLSRNNDNFRPCIGPFPIHVPPQAARVDHNVYRRKVAHNQINRGQTTAQFARLYNIHSMQSSHTFGRDFCIIVYR